MDEHNSDCFLNERKHYKNKWFAEWKQNIKNLSILKCDDFGYYLWLVKEIKISIENNKSDLHHCNYITENEYWVELMILSEERHILHR